ncbi:MAG: response regulator, partial [Planctomycetaceae bacterium]|nr:response regulator [Planctomycetaceae bacterium]
EAVRRAAVKRGLLTEEGSRPFGLREAVKVLLQGGVSTSGGVNQISGRGVGLDMVRETAERFKGEVEVDSTPGRGTVLRVSVPILLSSVTALMVEAGGTEAAIPLDSVRRSLRVAPEEFVRTPEGIRVSADGNLVPFRPLEDVLCSASPAAASRAWTVVLVRSGDVDAALGVDRLIGARTIVSRTLPPLLRTEPTVTGASLDAEGNPQLLLDPRHLAEAVRRNATDLQVARQAERLPILVIDDSLTTRMMEQSILEAAGYEVELAVSAEEGLEKAKKRRCGLFIVDVEMPGMNGFEFVRTTRADEKLKQVPAILVTSLNSEADKRRGREAGASDYMVKSEFDQERLLETIRRLIG